MIVGPISCRHMHEYFFSIESRKTHSRNMKESNSNSAFQLSSLYQQTLIQEEKTLHMFLYQQGIMVVNTNELCTK